MNEYVIKGRLGHLAVWLGWHGQVVSREADAVIFDSPPDTKNAQRNFPDVKWEVILYRTKVPFIRGGC